MNTSERTLCGNQIEQILTQQIQQVSVYIGYLSDIKKAISVNDTNKLNELLEKQQPNSELIENTQQQQASLLTNHGYETSDSGLTKCIEDCDNTAHLKTQKAELTSQLKELEKSLLINAVLVEKSQLRVKQSIRLLSGHDLPGQNSTYSKQGNIENPQESKHSLAQA